jgi:2-oxo-3-hexenedioate decarboxylase/2-keto-4-pentenoate hydratase
MTDETIELEALALAAEHRGRARFAPLPDHRLGDLAFAYAVQDRLIQMRQAAGAGAVVGWKIGFTTAPMQALAGISEPAAGAMLAPGVRSSGADLRRSDFAHLGLEGEIAVRVSEAFPETDPIATDQVLARLDGVAAALEVTDDRHADWSLIEAASLIRDNIWNIGAVIGPVAPAGVIGELTGRRGVLSIDGETREEGMSQDIGCDPLEIIAWLGAHLARRGQPLQPGQWIMTGSFVSTTFPEPGARYQFAVDGLEPVEATIV